MNAPAPLADDPITNLQARLERVALDPRVVLVPDGRAIVRELRYVLGLIRVHGEQLHAIEGAISSYVRLNGDRDCDSDN